MKPYSIDEYEKLPYNHVMCNLTPVMLGEPRFIGSFCNDHKIIVMSDKINLSRIIPDDEENFKYGYVVKPNKKDKWIA